MADEFHTNPEEQPSVPQNQQQPSAAPLPYQSPAEADGRAIRIAT